MKRRILIQTLSGAAALALLQLPASARAQEAPLRILVGFPAGGSIDTLARHLAVELTARLGRNVIVENRPGAGGQIAATALKAAPADGNTLFLTNSHTVSMIPLTVRHPGFEPGRDFVPVARVAVSPDVLAVNVKVVDAQAAGGGLRGFADWAKANPGKASVGVPAPASAPDFAVRMMASTFGADFNAVPYRGDGPVVQDLVAGQVAAGIGSVGAMSPYVKTGQLRLLAVNLPARMPAMPEVPTYTEQGLKGYESGNFVALFAPAGTPSRLVERYNAAVAAAATSPDFVHKLGTLGITPAHSSAQALAGLLQEADGAFAEMVKAAGFRMP
jgi:tripartite-type tricarboxylate transporter receptor subunit TctC